MFDRGKALSAALAGAIDLAVDFATLGEYGFGPAAEPACELDGHRAAWEALARPRRGGCPPALACRERPARRSRA
jgi:hypothetical protein